MRCFKKVVKLQFSILGSISYTFENSRPLLKGSDGWGLETRSLIGLPRRVQSCKTTSQLHPLILPSARMTFIVWGGNYYFWGKRLPQFILVKFTNLYFSGAVGCCFWILSLWFYGFTFHKKAMLWTFNAINTHTHTHTPCHSQLGPQGNEVIAGTGSADCQLGEISTHVCQHSSPLLSLAVR